MLNTRSAWECSIWNWRCTREPTSPSPGFEPECNILVVVWNLLPRKSFITPTDSQKTQLTAEHRTFPSADTDPVKYAESCKKLKLAWSLDFQTVFLLTYKPLEELPTGFIVELKDLSWKYLSPNLWDNAKQHWPLWALIKATRWSSVEFCTTTFSWQIAKHPADVSWK